MIDNKYNCVLCELDKFIGSYYWIGFILGGLIF